MKKIALGLMIASLSLTCYSQQAKSQTNEVYASSSELASAPAVPSDTRISDLQFRLTEINATDKSEMTSLERKDLREEERSIRRELKENNGGLYISGGALVVIIVLLIIFL